MGLFDNIANLVEDNISDVAMGYIGQMNLLHAEGRVADTEKAKDAATAAAANKKAMWSKYFELTKTDVGKETIAGTGWLEANYTNLLDTGLLETMIGIVHDIDASKIKNNSFRCYENLNLDLSIQIIHLNHFRDYTLNIFFQDNLLRLFGNCFLLNIFLIHQLLFLFYFAEYKH